MLPFTPTPSFTDSLIALKAQYERSLTEANTNASYLREQLSHVNALLLNQLLQGNEVMPSQTEAEVPVVAVIALAPAALAPTAEAPASDHPKPKASDHKTTAEPQPTPEGRTFSREMLPAYRGLTRLEAIAQVLEASAGEEVSIDAVIHALFGALNATDHKTERKRLITLLYNGEKRGLWQKGSATLSYVISTSRAKAKSPTTAKSTAQPKAKAKPAPAKSRRSLEVLPVFRGMSKREAIAQILEQRSGEVLHQDTIIQTLYGDLSPQDIKDERVRIKTALLTGVKDGKWQKAFEPSSYFIKAPVASAKPKRPGRKPDPSKEPKPEPVAQVEATAQTKPVTTKQRSSLDVLPAFEGLSKLDAIAKVLEQHPREVLHQDTIIQNLYGDLSPEDLKKERVRMDTSLRNGVKANKWKKAPVPASYVLEAIAPASAQAKVAKPKLERKPAVAKAKVGRSQKTERPKKTELELVALLRKANIQV